MTLGHSLRIVASPIVRQGGARRGLGSWHRPAPELVHLALRRAPAPCCILGISRQVQGAAQWNQVS